MGYDQRFYIVNRNKGMESKIFPKHYYCEILAMYEYCCDNQLADFIDKNGEPSECYLFVNDFETEQIKDPYGEEFKAIDICRLIDYLEKNPDEDYRRYKPFINMLKGFADNFENFDDLLVIRYGH